MDKESNFWDMERLDNISSAETLAIGVSQDEGQEPAAKPPRYDYSGLNG